MGLLVLIGLKNEDRTTGVYTVLRCSFFEVIKKASC